MKETISKTLRNEPADKTKNRAKLYCSAVSYDRIREWKEEVPYEMHSDIAVVFYLQEDRDGCTVITPITNAIVEELGLKRQEIMRRAWKNTVSEKRAVMMSLADMLGEEEEEGMPKIYVLSNEDMHLGAVTMFYPGLLAVIAKELGGDLCILPSSVHECLIMPMKADTDIGELKKIVRKVNETEVEKEDILSYNVYRFSRRSGRVEIDNF